MPTYWSDLWQMTIRSISTRRSSSALRTPSNQPRSKSLAGTGVRRTVEQLLGAAARRAEARTRAATEKAERERQRLARAQAAARDRYLDGLVGRVDELWQHVEALVGTKRQTDYDAAVRAIQDLHDLAARRRQLDVFAPRLQELRARHAKKVSLLERLDRAPLT
jgi:hypothetical protein